jgi:hypothetical protein
MRGRHVPPFGHRTITAAVGTLAALGLAACSSSEPAVAPAPLASSATAGPAASAPPRVTTGQRTPGLDFRVNPVAPAPAASAPTAPQNGLRSAPTTDALALQSFGQSMVDGDTTTAFALLTSSDRNRYVNEAQFAVELGREPGWESFTVDGTKLNIERDPGLDTVTGLVSPRATVVLPTVRESDGVRIAWSKRRIENRVTADESAAAETARRWTTTRQQCGDASDDETVNGILGVVGLANALCSSTGDVTVGDTLWLLDLDDPDAVLDAYGSDAAEWARVVEISSPVAMDVVLAPIDTEWKVIATMHRALARGGATIPNTQAAPPG